MPARACLLFLDYISQKTAGVTSLPSRLSALFCWNKMGSAAAEGAQVSNCTGTGGTRQDTGEGEGEGL